MFRIISKFLVNNKLSALGKRSGIVMPLEYLSVGRELNDLKSREDAFDLIEKYYNHENIIVNRAVLIAIRFIGKEAVEKFLDKLLESTKSNEGWIRYDAIWALGDSGIVDNRIYESFKRVAEDYSRLNKEELEKINPTEDDEYAKKMAAEKLLEYNLKTK